MYCKVRHSIPGRIRIQYDNIRVTPHQAALAESLISVQEGISEISFNPISGTFLIHYQPDKITEAVIVALFKALDSKYLDNEEMLASVPEPSAKESLLGTLSSMTIHFMLKKLLPLNVRRILRWKTIFPRILKGVECLASGVISDTRVLDAAAISISMLTGNQKTADNIAFLLSVGETVEDYTRRQSFDNLALSMFSGNESVHVITEDGNEVVMPLATVKKGYIIVARTGDMVQADGEVADGEALINQAAITGEPLAVGKRKGSSVFAGTVVEEGEIKIIVRSIGDDTKVSKIISAISSSTELKVSSEIRSEQLADKLVKYNFLLSLSVLVFTRNISKVVSTLMVDYSCAMKLVAPIAVLSAMKEAATHGIIIKGGKFLEDAAKADTIVFDKTGTLTNAAPALSRIIPFCKRKEDSLLCLAACLEEHYVHPIAKAIVEAATARGLEHPEHHAKVEYIVAHGIASSVNGKRVLIGSRHFIFEDEHIDKPKDLAKLQEEALHNGESLLYLAEDGKLIAAFAVCDPIRRDAADIISRLRETGVKECVMITGDDEGAAAAIAKQAGLDFYISRALPEDKANFIKAKKASGSKVVMLGDGINDAPALAIADTGIAMGESAAIAGETADIVLSGDNSLQNLVEVRLLGQRLLEKIQKNNIDIIAVNSSFILLGLLGILSPSLSAILHNMSTVFFTIGASEPLLGEDEWV